MHYICQYLGRPLIANGFSVNRTHTPKPEREWLINDKLRIKSMLANARHLGAANVPQLGKTVNVKCNPYLIHYQLDT